MPATLLLMNPRRATSRPRSTVVLGSTVKAALARAAGRTRVRKNPDGPKRVVEGYGAEYESARQVAKPPRKPKSKPKKSRENPRSNPLTQAQLIAALRAQGLTEAELAEINADISKRKVKKMPRKLRKSGHSMPLSSGRHSAHKVRGMSRVLPNPMSRKDLEDLLRRQGHPEEDVQAEANRYFKPKRPKVSEMSDAERAAWRESEAFLKQQESRKTSFSKLAERLSKGEYKGKAYAGFPGGSPADAAAFINQMRSEQSKARNKGYTATYREYAAKVKEDPSYVGSEGELRAAKRVEKRRSTGRGAYRTGALSKLDREHTKWEGYEGDEYNRFRGEWASQKFAREQANQFSTRSHAGKLARVYLRAKKLDRDAVFAKDQTAQQVADALGLTALPNPAGGDLAGTAMIMGSTAAGIGAVWFATAKLSSSVKGMLPDAVKPYAAPLIALALGVGGSWAMKKSPALAKFSGAVLVGGVATAFTAFVQAKDAAGASIESKYGLALGDYHMGEMPRLTVGEYHMGAPTQLNIGEYHMGQIDVISDRRMLAPAGEAMPRHDTRRDNVDQSITSFGGTLAGDIFDQG